MSEEREERYKELSEKLTKIYKWTCENEDKWQRIAFYDRNYITVEELELSIQECLLRGHMELYLLLIAKLSEIADINLKTEKYHNFVKLCFHKDLQLSEIDNYYTEIKETPKDR